MGHDRELHTASNTSALALNVTAVDPTQLTYLTLWAADDSQPVTSNLNPAPGQPPTSNAVNVELSSAGEFKVFNELGMVDVIIDVVGVYDHHNHDDSYLDKAQDSEAAIGGDDTIWAMSLADTVVASVTVDTPTSGYVIVNSSNYAYAPSGDVVARCAISTSESVGSYLQNQTVTNLDYASMAGTRGFRINKAVLNTPDEVAYNMVCDSTSGSWTLFDPQLTAVFIPDPDAFGRK